MIRSFPKEKTKKRKISRTGLIKKLDEEEWRDIEGFEGLYQVSNLGRVRSVDRFVFNKANGTDSFIRGTIMKFDMTGKLYAQVGLANNGKYKKKLIHRLVAKTFIPNPNNYPEVNHIDHNKLNNEASNLNWMTRLKNARYAKAHGRYDNFPSGERKSNAILTADAVKHIREKVLRNIEYCRLYGVKPSTVSCLQNPTKYGSRWPTAKL